MCLSHIRCLHLMIRKIQSLKKVKNTWILRKFEKTFQFLWVCFPTFSSVNHWLALRKGCSRCRLGEGYGVSQTPRVFLFPLKSPTVWVWNLCAKGTLISCVVYTCGCACEWAWFCVHTCIHSQFLCHFTFIYLFIYSFWEWVFHQIWRLHV